MTRFLWTQKQDIGPKPRFGHAAAYDAVRKRVVLFGGGTLRGQLFNDTWEWDGENWTQVADIGPSGRREFGMVYDAVQKKMVLFGGITASGLAGDTWEWAGEDWTQVADTGPSPRGSQAMTFDSFRKRIVLFGGEVGGSLASDTWEWDNVDWTQQDETGPSARRSPAMAYDANRRRAVLFGGDTGGAGGGGTALGDTWEWDGMAWTQAADVGPDPCFGAAMVFGIDRVDLFGGISLDGAVPVIFGNTWEWDGKHWTQRQDIGPGPRWLPAMAYDNIEHKIVLHGGSPIFALPGGPAIPDPVFGDTWEHPVIPGPVVPGQAVTLQTLSVAPSTISRGGIFGSDQNVTCTVGLSGPAPAGGATVQIQANTPTPATRQLVITAGSVTGQMVIPIHTNAFMSTGVFQIAASMDGLSRTAPLTIS